MNAPVDFDVVVVGAGATGLAAADRLASRGRRVLVVEAAAGAGGLLRSVGVGGARIEAYYHHVFPQDREVLALIDRLGLREKLEWRKASTAVCRNGALHPFDTALDVLRFRPLSPFARLRLSAGSLGVCALPTRLTDRWRISRAGPVCFGRSGFEALWRPLLVGKFGELAPQVATAWLQARMRQRLHARGRDADHLGYLRDGFAELVDRYVASLQDRAEFAFGAPVSRIDRAGDAWSVSFGDRSVTAASVVACVPGDRLEAVAALPDAYRERLAGIPYRGVVCVLLELDRPIGDDYWVNLTDPTRFNCLALIEHTNFIPPERYGGRHLAYLTHYVSPDTAVWSASPEEIVEAVLPAIRTINPDFDPSWIRGCQLSKDRWAQPVPLAGGTMPGLPVDTGAAGLFHASLAHIYPDDRGISLALRLGARVAHAAETQLAASGR